MAKDLAPARALAHPIWPWAQLPIAQWLARLSVDPCVMWTAEARHPRRRLRRLGSHLHRGPATFLELNATLSLLGMVLDQLRR